MELDLSPDERDLLLEILGDDLRRLRWDSARTHRSTFRVELRAREDLMERLLAKLHGLAMPVVSL